MPSILTVVLVLLLFATSAVIFWSCLVMVPGKVAILCPEECRCDSTGYYVTCYAPSLTALNVIRITNVQLLELSENNILLFERDSFVSLTELERLFVFRCGLSKIELAALNGLTYLTKLYIVGNEISEIIPGTFENMISLEYLDLSNNRLKHLDSGVFSGLINLKYIDLTENSLHYLQPDTFLGLPNIQNISLNGNRGLQVPTDRHFIQSLSLSHLLMSDCNISSLSVETFANVISLEWLDLRHNNLRTLDINILTALPKLSALLLGGNRLQCDCQLQEVWRWCEDRNIELAIGVSVPECYTPSEVEGKWLGVLEKGQCLEGNMQYYEDYNSTSYSYTDIDKVYTDTQADIQTETETEFEKDTNMNMETDTTLKYKRAWTRTSRWTGTQTNTQRRKVTKLPERGRRNINLLELKMRHTKLQERIKREERTKPSLRRMMTKITKK